MSTETTRTIRDDGHLDFRTVPEPCKLGTDVVSIIQTNQPIIKDHSPCKTTLGADFSLVTCTSTWITYLYIFIQVQCSFPSTETVRIIRDGGAHDGHLDFHTVPELCKVGSVA